MKAWIASLCLFLLLLAAIVGNAIYIHRVAEHLCGITDALCFEGPDTEDALNELASYWERHRSFVALSIGYRELDHVCETMISLRTAYDTRNASDFECYRQLLSDAVQEIARLERFSVENLF